MSETKWCCPVEEDDLYASPASENCALRCRPSKDLKALRLFKEYLTQTKKGLEALQKKAEAQAIGTTSIQCHKIYAQQSLLCDLRNRFTYVARNIPEVRDL